MNLIKFSSFWIDLRLKNYESLKNSINDLKDVIPKEEEIIILDNYIHELKDKVNLNKNLNDLDIIPNYNDALKQFNPGLNKLNDKYKIIDSIIKNYPKRKKLTLKKYEIYIRKILEFL